MGITTTAIVIAVLAGLACFYSWDRNRGLSLGLAIVAGIAAFFGLIGAFFWALGVIFKLIPIVLLVGAIWLIVRRVRS